MTAGPKSNKAARLNRRPSDIADPEKLALTPDKVDDESSSDETRLGRKRSRDGDHPRLGRLVSQDAQYISENDEDSLEDKKEKAPMRCESDTEGSSSAKSDAGVPPQLNPLHNSSLLSAHISALRLEAELFPMRQQVARLMAHPTHNRRGLFNFPVDPVALRIFDYEKVITKPRDLGTIKAKLHAVAYHSREEVADDIRLVFTNAMTYNPPNNTVHIAAKNLLQAFEEAYEVMKATSNPASISVQKTISQSYSNLDAARNATGSAVRRGVTRSLSMINVATPTAEPAAAVPLPTYEQVAQPTTHEQLQHAEGAPPSSSQVSQLSTAASVSAVPSDSVEAIAQNPWNTASPERSVSLAVNEFSSIAVAAAMPSCAPVDTKCGLRGSISTTGGGKNPFATPPQAEKALKRAMNVAAKHAKHSCRSCIGRSCAICEQGCLSHEPALLICTGSNCLGAKIRKGAVYYIAKDGTRQFCQRCYTNLQAVLPHTSDQIDSFGSSVRYKRDLLKRKNEEDVAEAWLTCRSCDNGVHKICAMHNEFVHSEDSYECPSCPTEPDKILVSKNADDAMKVDSDQYTCVSGSEIPVKLDDLTDSQETWAAESLPETPVSAFIQQRVRDCIAATKIPNAEKTVTVRVISDCSKKFKVPEVVRKHFRQPAPEVDHKGVIPPVRVNYKSKAITLFQKIDGLDVCIFMMYVQEYDCKDDFDGDVEGEQKKRVYIAYLDSVEHFRPRVCRTEVFREILVAYLATARARGYESAHIWACPPSRGNSFVFWNHPASQRTPTKERLISWYHGALKRCVESGVITDVKSLFESSFPLSTIVRSTDAAIALSPENMTVCEEGVLDGRITCPPLMDGDYWIEEAVRLHATSIVKHLKSKPSHRDLVTNDERCPAVQVATLLRDRVMAQQSATPFRLPVNAASLKLNDYHKVISKPMDLGTVYSRCILGEFDTLQDVVDDVELVFSNAMRYNPKGHAVHDVAIETSELFFKELDALTKQWLLTSPVSEAAHSWKLHADTSMSLDNLVEEPLRDDPQTPTPVTALVIPADEPAAVGQIESLVACAVHEMKSELKILIPGSPPLEPISPPFSNSMGSALLPNAGRKPVTHQSPASLKRTSTAMFNLLNSKLELLTGGEDAILQKMVGNDIWIMDKKAPNTPKAAGTGKKKAAGKGTGKRKKGTTEASASEDPPAKRRRQSWLGEEVGLSVRKMRTSFFSCSLVQKTNMSDDEIAKERDFQEYIAPFVNSSVADIAIAPSRIADARHAFLEFSQYRNLEFDTLRRAKYSTSILLYHLHHDDAPGLIPSCSSCHETIQDIRWHRIRRVEERHHTGRVPPTLRAARMAQAAVAPEVAEACHKGEELCAPCYDKRSTKEEFIPLPVSFKA